LVLTADWEPTYRARRIAELLDGPAHDLDGFAALQEDQRSLLAEDLLPLMLEAEPASPEAADAMVRLAAWDRVMAAVAAEPLIFAAWYRELSRLIYADELGELFPAFWHLRPQFMDRVLRVRTVWCDDVATPEVEDCPTMATRALDLALADLHARFGEAEGWRWGEAHPARMAHAIFEDLPALGWLFNLAVATGGDGVTVNVGHYVIRDRERPFASVHAASYRGLYDLADLDRSRFMASTGQSGNPLSAHYGDLTEPWAAGAYLPMLRQADRYGEGALGRLRLLPQ
jgi:penicillin amidase